MKRSESQRSTGVWQADLISIGALIALVVLVYLLDNALQPVFSPLSLLITGIILALAPAIVWIAFFYRRDRLEPEPKSMVLQLFLLGGLLAAGVGIPFLGNVFSVEDWISRTTTSHLLGAILVIGFTEEFLKYAAVRYSVYHSNEFDEPVDGVIYATAAGLGYAAVLNIAFVVSSGGIDLGAGIIKITLTSLAQASFAGITGYFLGTAKFGSKPVWWTAAGVGLAAVLNGLFYYLRTTITRGELSSAGGEAQSWLGLALAAVLAGLVTYMLSGAIRKQVKRVAAGKES